VAKLGDCRLRRPHETIAHPVGRDRDFERRRVIALDEIALRRFRDGDDVTRGFHAPTCREMQLAAALLGVRFWGV